MIMSEEHNSFKLHIHTAKRDFYNGDSTSVIVPTTQGKYGIMAHHRNMVAAVVAGEMEFVDENNERIYVVTSPGLVKVENNEVLLLVNEVYTYEELDGLDEKKQREARTEAELHKNRTKEYLDAEAEMRRAIYGLRRRRHEGWTDQ